VNVHAHLRDFVLVLLAAFVGLALLRPALWSGRSRPQPKSRVGASTPAAWTVPFFVYLAETVIGLFGPAVLRGQGWTDRRGLARADLGIGS
jgi:hypothetical protein